jgi:hypothetical protein
MEPTAYAMLALEGHPDAGPAIEKARGLVMSWQSTDGGWQPAAHVKGATWVTALGVTLCTVQGDYGRSFQNGVQWLLRSSGVESTWLNRLKQRLLGGVERDTSNRGWPWRAETSAWVEPTAHTLIALKRAASRFHDHELQVRIREGEDLLLSVRSRDGGWNYGSASALGIALPSYPETTALAVLGLQQRAPADWPAPEGPTTSRLADAWLAIATNVLGRPAPHLPPADPPADLMIAALEALADPRGGGSVFRVGTS